MYRIRTCMCIEVSAPSSSQIQKILETISVPQIDTRPESGDEGHDDVQFDSQEPLVVNLLIRQLECMLPPTCLPIF